MCRANWAEHFRKQWSSYPLSFQFHYGFNRFSKCFKKSSWTLGAKRVENFGMKIQNRFKAVFFRFLRISWVEFRQQGNMLTFRNIPPNLCSLSFGHHSIINKLSFEWYNEIYELHYESQIMIFSYSQKHTLYINHLKNVNRISSQKEVITHQATDHNQRQNCVLHFQMNID